MSLGHKGGAPSPEGDLMGAMLYAAFPAGDRDCTAPFPPFVRGKGDERETPAHGIVFLGMADPCRDSDLPSLRRFSFSTYVFIDRR